MSTKTIRPEDELVEKLCKKYRKIYVRGDRIVLIKYYEPYDEERFQHYKALVDELNKLRPDKRSKNFAHIGRKRLEREEWHYEKVKREWHDEVVAILKKYGQNVKDYEKIEDTDGWAKHRNPILYDEDKKVVDKEAVYTDKSTIIKLNIPKRLEDGKLFLTDERVEWLVKELMF